MNVTLKLAGLLVILLIGVVLGLQTAERGIARVSGLPEQPQSFYIKKVDQGKVEFAVMGKPVQADNPQKVVNYVSNMGATLGAGIKNGAKTFVEWIGGFFQP